MTRKGIKCPVSQIEGFRNQLRDTSGIYGKSPNDKRETNSDRECLRKGLMENKEWTGVNTPRIRSTGVLNYHERERGRGKGKGTRSVITGAGPTTDCDPESSTGRCEWLLLASSHRHCCYDPGSRAECRLDQYGTNCYS